MAPVITSHLRTVEVHEWKRGSYKLVRVLRFHDKVGWRIHFANTNRIEHIDDDSWPNPESAFIALKLAYPHRKFFRNYPIGV